MMNQTPFSFYAWRPYSRESRLKIQKNRMDEFFYGLHFGIGASIAKKPAQRLFGSKLGAGFLLFAICHIAWYNERNYDV